MKKTMQIGVMMIISYFIMACSSTSQQQGAIDEKATTTISSHTEQTNEVANNDSEQNIVHYQLTLLPIELTVSSELPIARETLSKQLLSKLTSQFNQTKEFALTPFQSVTNNGNDEKLMTDFYLKNMVIQFNAENTLRILKATGQGVEEKQVSISVEYQIISAKNQQVISSNTLHTRLKSTIYTETLDTAIANTLSKMAKLIKNEVTNMLYPIEITNVSDHEKIILSRPLSIDTQCSIISTDNKTVTGQIIVTHNNKDSSYGKKLSGQVKQGDICQPLQMIAPQLIQQTPQGGIILPFH